jgi:predicted CXXCH cytochrome family protein
MLEKACGSAVVFACILISTCLGVEKPTTPQKTCVTKECHADFGKKAYVHGPVGLGDCKACHKPVDPNKHTFQLARKGKDLCEYCHLEQATKKNVHDPLKTGDCTQCHNPHSSDNKFLLPVKTVGDLCNKCHKVTQGRQFLHGPTAVGECTVCHEPHSSDYPNLLVTDHAKLCFSCHTVTQDELKKYEFVHPPAKNDCTGCHDPHGANNPKMIKNLAPFLCYACHKDIEKIVKNAKVPHRVVSDVGGCLNCHTPHASTVKFLLKKDVESLCVTCHDKPVTISKDEVLPSFTKEIKGKKYLHGPVAQGNCSGCHLPHGSQYFRLLIKAYPAEFYAPFKKDTYALCFSCHPESLVLTPETSDLTDFRNGKMNLHYVHVNRPVRGRTCRACHAVHASNLPKHIRDSVPYGVWNLPIGFKKTPTGGSCSPGCHLPHKYDRKNPVVYENP